MAKLQVTNFKNKKSGEVDLHDEIAETILSPFVIKDSVVASLAAKRQGTHKAKNRSEVAGSTKKLFRQKGTGNARAGSIKSPLRRHGGVVFGPVPRSHDVKMNKKARNKALASVIAEKIRQKQLIVLEDLKLKSHKTKEFIQILKGMKLEKVIFVYSELEKEFELASRNVQSVSSVHSTGLSVYDVLNHKHLVMTKDALKDVEGRLLK